MAEGLEVYFDEEQIEAALAIAKLMHQHLKDCRHISFDNAEESGLYVVSPVLLVGRTKSGYLAGLWSHEVRT